MDEKQVEQIVNEWANNYVSELDGHFDEDAYEVMSRTALLADFIMYMAYSDEIDRDALRDMMRTFLS